MTSLPGYALRRLVHRGRNFDVFDAWSFDRESPVIVKRARPGAPVAAGRRLLAEGERLLGLSHPFLVRAYEVHPEPRPSVVLETLPGRTAADLFESAGPLSMADVVQLGQQLTSVLGYLHRHGLVHADVKPANATVSDGHIRLIDLSLAQPPGPWDRSAGTPGYLAPEQARRERVTAATDVWGLGLMLLEAATGEEPFGVGTPAYDEQHGPLAAPPPLRRRRLPRALSDLVERMTQISPHQRPPLADVRRQLTELSEARGLR